MCSEPQQLKRAEHKVVSVSWARHEYSRSKGVEFHNYSLQVIDEVSRLSMQDLANKLIRGVCAGWVVTGRALSWTLYFGVPDFSQAIGVIYKMPGSINNLALVPLPWCWKLLSTLRKVYS